MTLNIRIESKERKKNRDKTAQPNAQISDHRRRSPKSLDNISIPLEFINSSSPEHIFISDKDGRFSYVSPAGARAMGLNPDDIIGKTWNDLGFTKGSEPFDSQRQTVFVTGQPVTGETNFATYSGKKSYEYILSPIFDIDDSVEAVECMVKDVTENKCITRAIQDARQYSEILMETVHEPLLVLDADMRVIQANQSFYQTFKIKPEETEWKFIYELANNCWNIPLLHEFFEKFLSKKTVYERFEITHDFPRIGQKT
ncbi:MAG: PAS domain-containing protein, partial [Thermoplasmata archaeon]|nr:PAS domain-containing protein [Thermoplasmata archaeon]